MNSVGQDIKDILVSESAGYVFGTNLFVGKEPAMPDNCITIFDTPGFPPQLTLDRTEIYEYPTIQIRVRDQGYQDGFTTINNIKDLLHGIGQDTVNGTFYSLIACSSGPALLDWDEKERCRWIANFMVQRR